MTIYNVHIFREMKLRFDGIEAETPEGAAAIARDKLTQADDLDDCDGETFSALVDVHGDEEYEKTRLIDFEAERARKAVPTLLAACRWMMSELCVAWDEPAEIAIPEHFRATIAEATLACATSDPAATGHFLSPVHLPSSPHTKLKLTREMAERMSNPARDVVYSPHSICSMEIDQVQWTHPDEQYVITFDRATETFTGQYYDWDDETQDWVDTAPMTGEQIKDCIERNRLVFAR
jgi:hypothetical protein